MKYPSEIWLAKLKLILKDMKDKTISIYGFIDDLLIKIGYKEPFSRNVFIVINFCYPVIFFGNPLTNTGF